MTEDLQHAHQHAHEREKWEELYREKLALSPPEISMDYAVQLTIVLFQFRDLMKEIEEDHRDALAELDDSYNDLLMAASKAYYRLGYLDAMNHLNNEGDR